MNTARSLATALIALAVGFACDGSPTSAPLSLALAQQSALERRLLAEKERLSQEAERSKPVYDALKAEWDKFLRDYQVTASGIVSCEPLPYAADVRIVGPEGAEIIIGPHNLMIPRGALTTYMVITAERPVSLSVGVRLSPDGITFARQPQLTLNYKHCHLPTEHRERIAQVDEALKVLAYPTARDQTDNEVVTAWLWHFSNYAIAW